MRLQKIVLLTFLSATTLFACNTSAQKVTDLSVSDFEKGIMKPGIQVLDVRTPGEFATGHLNKAVLADWMNQEAFPGKVKSLDKKKPVYTYCLVGGRSSAAAQWLMKNGYTVYNLNGGIKAWNEAGKPLSADGKN